MLKANEIYSGDCTQLMKDIDDNSIDAVITDPPYVVLQETSETWDKQWDMGTFAYEANRVLKNTGYFFCFGLLRFFHNLMQYTDKYFRVYFDLVWVKTSSVNFIFAKHKPLPKHEQIACFIKHCAKSYSMTYNYRDIGTYKEPYNRGYPSRRGKLLPNLAALTPSESKDGFRYPTSVIECYSRNTMPYAERTEHPAQKPLLLLEHIVLGFTNKNDIVLDPFIGSGSTAVACIKHNRNFIGIDLDETYVDISRERVKNELTQLRLEV